MSNFLTCICLVVLSLCDLLGSANGVWTDSVIHDKQEAEELVRRDDRRLGDMAVDGIFWQLLAYCAGVGGSMLIIGSAAGVVVMGLEKITFGWYMKNISWVAFVGYIAGILCYWAEKTLLF